MNSSVKNNENTRLIFIVVRRVVSSLNADIYDPVKFYKLIPSVNSFGQCSLKKGQIISDLLNVPRVTDE
jgi:hypothetical protein